MVGLCVKKTLITEIFIFILHFSEMVRNPLKVQEEKNISTAQNYV